MKSKMARKENEEEIQEAFNAFDPDGSGSITSSSLKQAFAAMNESFTDKEINEMIKVVGTDGSVNFNQFKNMMLMR